MALAGGAAAAAPTRSRMPAARVRELAASRRVGPPPAGCDVDGGVLGVCRREPRSCAAPVPPGWLLLGPAAGAAPALAAAAPAAAGATTLGCAEGGAGEAAGGGVAAWKLTELGLFSRSISISMPQSPFAAPPFGPGPLAPPAAGPPAGGGSNIATRLRCRHTAGACRACRAGATASAGRARGGRRGDEWRRPGSEWQAAPRQRAAAQWSSTDWPASATYICKLMSPRL